MLQPLQLADFSGGMTDQFVGVNPRMFQRAKNFYLTVDAKPAVRPGSVLEGGTDTFCKLPGAVNSFLPAFTSTGIPLKLSNNTSAGRLYAHNGTTHVEIQGPTSNPIFTSTHAAHSDPRFISSSWNGHRYVTSASFTQKPQKVYQDNSGVVQLRTAGLPTPVDNNTWALSGGVGAVSVVYAVGWKYTYTSGGKTFVDRGPLLRKTYTLGPTVSMTGLPTLSNGATDNYDTSHLVLEVYRTTNNGRTLYYVGEVTNGTTIFSDAVGDSTLQTNSPHYTAGGIPEFDPPPMCKFVHVTERGIGIYGYVQDGSDESKNMFKQSIANAPDKVPGSFNGELDSEMTGVSSHKGTPILFSRKQVYRGEGIFTQTGQGGMIPRKIADSVGCISHTSIVQTPEGLFFAGEAGFYWTDGFRVEKISDLFNTTYQTAYSSGTVQIHGTYDETERVVLWTFPESTNSDGIFVFHLRFGIKPDGAFTTWGGLTSPTTGLSGVYPAEYPATVNQNFRAKCLLSFNNRIYRGDDRGYAMYFSASSKTDPRVDAAANCSAWGTSAIRYDFRSAAMNFGSDFVRKFTPKVIVNLKNRGNVSLAIYSDRDLEGRPKACKEIRHRSSFSWGDAGILWGDPIIFSSDQALYEDVRMLPVPGLRCSYRQLYFQNSFTVVQKSDNLGTGTVDATAKTVVLDNVSNTWPSDILDLYISFLDGQGKYSQNFRITARTNTTVTFSDASGIIASNLSSTPWEIHGFAKGEIVEIQSVVLPCLMLDSTQAPYQTGSEGGNA